MSLLTDLVAHWKLDEASGSRLDSHGTSDLTDNNTVGSAVGKIGDAADFIKTNSEHLSKSSLPAGLKVGTYDWSLAFWVNPDAAETTGLFRWTTDPSFDVIMTSTRIVRCLVYDASAAATVKDSTDLLTVGAWNFVILSYDATAQEFRIKIGNGTTKTFAQASVRGTNTVLNIGLSLGSFSNCLIDSVSFWNRVLTPTEESDLWNSGNGLDYESFGTAAVPQTPDAVVVNVVCPAPTIGVAPVSVAVNVTCPNTTVGVATDSATVTATLPAPSAGVTVQTVQVGVTASAPVVGASCDTATLSISCPAPSITGTRIPDVSIVSVVVPNPTVGIAVTSIPILVYAPSTSSGGTLSVEGPLLVQYGAPAGNRISHSGPSGNVIVKSPARGGYARYDEDP